MHYIYEVVIKFKQKTLLIVDARYVFVLLNIYENKAVVVYVYRLKSTFLFFVRPIYGFRVIKIKS